MTQTTEDFYCNYIHELSEELQRLLVAESDLCHHAALLTCTNLEDDEDLDQEQTIEDNNKGGAADAMSLEAEVDLLLHNYETRRDALLGIITCPATNTTVSRSPNDSGDSDISMMTMQGMGLGIGLGKRVKDMCVATDLDSTELENILLSLLF